MVQWVLDQQKLWRKEDSIAVIHSCEETGYRGSQESWLLVILVRRSSVQIRELQIDSSLFCMSSYHTCM